MAEPLEVRICLRPVQGFKVEISLYDCSKRKESKIGLKVGPSQADIDLHVWHLKNQLEKNGSYVTVVNLDRQW